jgi:hypothetical protein
MLDMQYYFVSRRGMMNVLYTAAGIWLSVWLFEFVKYVFRGYIVYHYGPETLIYKERGKDKLFFYFTARYKNKQCDGMDIHVPEIEKWKREMPDWAKYRKPIIVQRLKSHCRKIDNPEILDYK